jgi:hypothetical protein
MPEVEISTQDAHGPISRDGARSLALRNSAETLGIFEAFERQSRDLAALAAFGVGLTGAGLVAGVGGILNALVSQRAAARDPRCDRERKC